MGKNSKEQDYEERRESVLKAAERREMELHQNIQYRREHKIPDEINSAIREIEMRLHSKK